MTEILGGNRMRGSTLVLTLIACTATNVHARMLFYASFDKSVNADLAAGSPTAKSSKGRLLQLSQPRRFWGRALGLVDQAQAADLQFNALRNVNLQRGTIEFFAKLPRVKGRRVGQHFFRFSGDRTFMLSIAPRPNGQGLVLSYTWNRSHRWVYYSERFVYLDTWQHFAVTWDMMGGKGKGKLSVFVDGTRRLHNEDLNPQKWAFERLYVGGEGRIGNLDDFAIFDEVLYKKQFVPRRKPLTDLARATRNSKATRKDLTQALLGHPFLHNGGFEKWRDGRPVGWRLHSGEAYGEEVMRIDGRKSLALSVDRRLKHPWPYSSMSSDPFTLEPNSQYRLRLWVTSKGTVGDIRLQVSATDGGTVTSYRTGWTRQHPWLQINQTFRTRGSRQYTMSLGAQSGFGYPVWFDSISIEKIGGAAPVGSTDLTVFSRSVMESLDLGNTLPSPAEAIDSLQIRLARGEFEPGLVALYSRRSLSQVRWQLQGDLVGPDGKKISATDVVIRDLDGPMLPLSRPRNLKPGDIRGWWITVRTRRKTPPGIYQGQITLRCGQQVLRQLPLRVEVMDLILPQPDIAFLMYHHEYYIPKQFLTPQLQQAYYRDMFDHGMNTVTVYNNGDVDGTSKVDFSKNYGYDKRHPQFQIGLDTQMKWIKASGLCRSGQPVLWLPSRTNAHGGRGYGWGGLAEKTLKSSLRAWQQRKWSEPLLYSNDEPGGTGPRAEAAKARLKEIKSWKAQVRTTTAGLDPEILGKYYDVWIAGDAGVTMKAAHLATEMKADLWTYNCTCNHRNMPFSRAFFGFWAFRTGVKGVAQWAYYDNPNWTADKLGRVGGNPRTRLSRVCVSPHGPIPTLSWEATREGIDDYRYAQKLRDLIQMARQRVDKLEHSLQGVLSKQDLEILKQREQQRIGQIKPKQKKIVWQPKNQKQARAEGVFLKLRKLRASLEAAKQAQEFAIRTIPFDAMRTRGYLAYHAPRWTRFCPPLGPAGLGENPRTATEVRRKILISYILSLQIALK